MVLIYILDIAIWVINEKIFNFHSRGSGVDGLTYLSLDTNRKKTKSLQVDETSSK